MERGAGTDWLELSSKSAHKKTGPRILLLVANGMIKKGESC